MKNIEKKEANVKMMDAILEHLSVAPESQIEPHLLETIITFKKQEHTAQEKFDFIQSIGDIKIMKFGKVGYGDISAFVKSLCDLKKFYLRPK